MKRKDRDWSGVWVLVLILILLFSIFISVTNTIALCKNQKVFWIKGTQYSCSIFK